jgi:hypothetical protein
MSGKYKKEYIPKALREQIWLEYIGKKYESKCTIIWCKNIISVFDFHMGHNLPESKGGNIDINNLRPICARCNLSMSDNYSIDEWNKLGIGKISCWRKILYYLGC